VSVAAEVSPPVNLARRVMQGIVWRSGSQIFAQLVTWAATFMVIRLLRPADYGIFAMTQSVLVLFGVLTGASFASPLVRQKEVSQTELRQVFGLLILLNAALAIMQISVAPLVAGYYRQPIVADLLRAQALLYLANPFIALGTALLSRELDFRKQAMAHFASAIAGAATALGGAMAGLGVWTLVAAPIALFWTRAVALLFATRWNILPSFRFQGVGATVGFGLAMVTSQFFWFLQTQADVFIGGRSLDPHRLGLYTTALFLAQILTAKFIPPINEVAYSAYSRLQGDPAAVAAAFAKSVRLIMLVALPFYCGMALVAGPLVEVVLGDHWSGAAPIVRLLACAMPLVTLQILFAPVTNALGKPRLAVFSSIAGAIIMPFCFAVGVRHGETGLAFAWLFGFPVLTICTAALSLPAMGLAPRGLAEAVLPALLAAAGMAAGVSLIDLALPVRLPGTARLTLLVMVGALSYGALVALVARSSIAELRDLFATRRLAIAR
jgi:O-antigen/teichoic acid export membrane protein